MKKIFVILICFLLLIGCTPVEKVVTGEYSGVGKGKNGDVEIKITLDGSVITDAKVIKTSETEGYKEASDKILKEIVARNMLEVDTVSGATYTSKATLEAVTNALKAAGLSAKDLKPNPTNSSNTKKDSIKEKHKLVIVGAGGAGMIAAIEAKLNGLDDVILIEKMPFVGGNTLISGAEMAAPGNDKQKAEGIKDSAELFYQDVLKGKGDPKLIRILADNALAASKWLTNEIGVEWEKELMFFGGHSVKRSLVPLGARGSEPVSKLKKKLEELKIPVYLNTKATELITNGKHQVIGVKASSNKADYEFDAEAVILTTGGFGNNLAMRKQYDKNVDEKVLSTNAKGIDGDGIVMAQKIGADLVGMEYIQLYPVCNPETGALLYVDDARLVGKTIIVNKEGKRFVEELNTRYAISMAVKAQSDSFGYELMTKQAAIEAGVIKNHQAEVDELKAKGYLIEANSLKEVADKMGVNANNLEATVKKWNEYVAGGKDLEFNKRGTLYKIEQGPYWLVKFAPAVHHTMGGIKIDEHTHVIDTEGNIIKGLYAAGEVTGGIHGNNRLGSAAIADITVFGRIAADTVIKEINNK